MRKAKACLYRRSELFDQCVAIPRPAEPLQPVLSLINEDEFLSLMKSALDHGFVNDQHERSGHKEAVFLLQKTIVRNEFTFICSKPDTRNSMKTYAFGFN